MYWMSSMSCTSTLSSEQTVSSCNLQGIREIRSIHSFHLITRVRMYLVEMRLKTALKLLQLRENRTPQAEFLSSDAYWFPSRYVWMKWQISGNNCFTSIVSSRRMLSFGCWEIKRVYRTSLEDDQQLDVHLTSKWSLKGNYGTMVTAQWMVCSRRSPLPGTSPVCPWWEAGTGKGSSLQYLQISALARRERETSTCAIEL